MTARLIEGFDHWNTFPFKGWSQYGTSSNGNISFDPGRFGSGTGTCLKFTQGSGTLGELKSLSTNYSTLVVGIAFMVTAHTGIGQRIFGLTDITTEQLSLRLDTAGRLIVSRNGTTLATETNTVFVGFQWYYLELKVTFHGSTGSYAVRRNGQTVTGISDATGQNTISTANAYANQIQLAGTQTAVNSPLFSVDDLYIFDTAGSENNDFVGERRVYTLYPTANGATTGFTNTGGASNAASVANTAQDGDSTYVSSATATTVDTYVTQDLPTTTNTINAVQFNLVARTTDAGLRTVGPVQRNSGGTQADGTPSEGLSGTYIDHTSIAEVSLVSGSSWTASEINGSQFGVKITS